MAGNVSRLLNGTFIPKMVRVKQSFPRPRIDSAEVADHVLEQLREDRFKAQIRSGMRVCIAVGSRGIANIAILARAVVDFCIEQGALPFIVPAMGSHGGATAKRQAEILATLGVTEASMGCPVVSCMDTVQIGITPDGRPVCIDRNAAQADAIILTCRVKPHTGFRGAYESGVMKMMAIGLGKQVGAESCHFRGLDKLGESIVTYGRIIRDNAPVAMAVAVVENAYDETARIDVLLPEEFDAKEPLLLKEAFSNMARLLFDKCDVLIVDRIGKNISGDGMDPNITGRFVSPNVKGGISSKSVGILGLTKETHHSGVGMGLADAICKRLWDDLDLDETYPNTITSKETSPVKIPPILDNDRETIQFCIRIANDIDLAHPRMIRISNTMELEHIMISEAMLEEARHIDGLTIESEPFELSFDENGNLF